MKMIFKFIFIERGLGQGGHSASALASQRDHSNFC
jgi:hypothetical protein